MGNKAKLTQFMLLGLLGCQGAQAVVVSQPPQSSQLTSQALKALVLSFLDIKQYTPVATLTVGPDFVYKNRSQTLTLLDNPFIYQNSYQSNASWQTAADAGGFVGLEHAFTNRFIMQFGVSGYVDAQLSPNGNVWQFADQRFDNLTFSYQIHHSRVMVESKLLGQLTRYASLHPYVSGGMGAAFNNAGAYQEDSITSGVSPSRSFSNHQQTSFTWAAGVGIDYDLSSHVRMGVGYQFANLGSASLEVSPGQQTTQTPSIANLYTNQIRFQATFII